MKKLTVRVPDSLMALFNETIRRRHTTQAKAVEIMMRDWISPSVVRAVPYNPPDLEVTRPRWLSRMVGWNR